MAANHSQGKSTSQEQSIIQKLKSLVRTDAKVYYILWKYAPHLLTDKVLKSFDDLKNYYKTFTTGMTETSCTNWLFEENVQSAVKWLLKRQHQEKMIQLYELYFEKAKEDTNAFKAFTEFSEKFFATEKESELLSILHGVDVEDEE
ncbi:hypothetical protein [Acetanaerobacterium elongatum]|uniref:Uncharacterized protein n=1 Tax=Acetanaerobacterium elongatum TaxID=258515 RepID=A0A1H0BMZ6_9FIRM|nr:hypothetical protein [Acetanaerobacterium elongatum]SDN46863.1 hypothetical protein SAMN05192585_1207 [Acetanaerobacterium elongatum]